MVGRRSSLRSDEQQRSQAAGNGASVIGILGSAALLVGLGLLASADGQPQAALGVALFMGGAALLMREVSARDAIEDARAAQVEALEDAREMAVKRHLAFLRQRDLEKAAEAQHDADLRYWSERHGASMREFVEVTR